jgi:thiamine biosynthesis lipoprotein
VEVRDVLMGTFVQIKGVGVKRETLSSIATYMKQLEQHFTRFKGDSELSLFNRNGVIRRPSGEILTVMKMAADGHRMTKGAFDVTVLPVMLHFEKYGRALTKKEESRYRERMGGGLIVLYDDIIYSVKPVKVTLDGIATGYVIDQAILRLMESGCLCVLANIGGDIYCGEKKGGWEVGIYDPFRDSISKKIALQNRAVCTSGSYVNYFRPDRKLHHIIDPATLTSPNDVVSATVTASTACRADFLSTALFVTGPPGKEFLREGERAYFITKDGAEITI